MIEVDEIKMKPGQKDEMALPGGYGITYLPSNTGYFSGPTDYGSSNFSTGVSQVPYGLTPAGVVAGNGNGVNVVSPGNRIGGQDASARNVSSTWRRRAPG